MAQICKNKIRNIKLRDVMIIISPFLVLFFYKISNILGVSCLCLWKFITGHDCIGCNITHAIIAILKFDFKRAFSLYPYYFFVFPILLYEWLKYIYKLFFKR